MNRIILWQVKIVMTTLYLQHKRGATLTISTRYNLHVPNTNLSKYQKGVYYTGIKLFNNPPPANKSLNQDIKSLSQH
jgi:hypothetical protein